MFTETEYAALLMRLAELGEEKFRAFNEKLMPGTTGTYGVRIPLLRTMAKEIIKLGMYIGLNGVATFKNARKALEVVETIPLERLVLETDCPYLAPEPCRGQRNNSALIPHIAARIGQVLGLSAQAVLRQTAENARALYGLQV